MLDCCKTVNVECWDSRRVSPTSNFSWCKCIWMKCSRYAKSEECDICCVCSEQYQNHACECSQLYHLHKSISMISIGVMFHITFYCDNSNKSFSRWNVWSQCLSVFQWGENSCLVLWESLSLLGWLYANNIRSDLFIYTTNMGAIFSIIHKLFKHENDNDFAKFMWQSRTLDHL